MLCIFILGISFILFVVNNRQIDPVRDKKHGEYLTFKEAFLNNNPCVHRTGDGN